MRLKCCAHTQHALKMLCTYSACAENQKEHAEHAFKIMKRMLSMRFKVLSSC
jgi:hypothetical protein